MDSPLGLFKENWFPVLQGVGIIGGLLFTALSIRRDTKARRSTDLLALAQQHRDLWSETYKNPELGRILAPTVDLMARKISIAEKEFLNVVFVHFYTGWLLAKQGELALIPMEAVEADIRGFFVLPIPQKVWNETRSNRDPKFVEFVSQCLTNLK